MSSDSKPAVNIEHGDSKTPFSGTNPIHDRDAKDIEKANVDTQIPTEQAKLKDPNLVDWDGPDDPTKAVNWSRKEKWSTIACLSAMTFITYA